MRSYKTICTLLEFGVISNSVPVTRVAYQYMSYNNSSHYVYKVLNIDYSVCNNYDSKLMTYPFPTYLQITSGALNSRVFGLGVSYFRTQHIFIVCPWPFT